MLRRTGCLPVNIRFPLSYYNVSIRHIKIREENKTATQKKTWFPFIPMLSTHSLLCSISLVVCECVQKCHKIFIMFLGSWIISSHKMYDIEPLIWATAPLYNGQNGLFSNFNRPSGTMFSIQSHHVWWLATSLSQCIATSIPYDVTVQKYRHAWTFIWQQHPFSFSSIHYTVHTVKMCEHL